MTKIHYCVKLQQTDTTQKSDCKHTFEVPSVSNPARIQDCLQHSEELQGCQLSINTGSNSPGRNTWLPLDKLRSLPKGDLYIQAVTPACSLCQLLADSEGPVKGESCLLAEDAQRRRWELTTMATRQPSSAVLDPVCPRLIKPLDQIASSLS
jgi:hypothetical protein